MNSKIITISDQSYTNECVNMIYLNNTFVEGTDEY